MPMVSVAKIEEDIVLAVKALLEPFRLDGVVSGKSVLIKPNLVEAVPFTTGQTTNPALVEAIVMWCKQMGAGKIAIGEGPSYFQPKAYLKECFTRTGISDVAERQGISWILFDDGLFRMFRNHSPRTPGVFSISEHAFIWDYIINVPVPKTHYLTGVSLAMKNLKGFIKWKDKPLFHHCGTEHIYGSVTELNLLIRPLLNIVDCTAPTHRNCNFVLAGTDIVATDAVTASFMGINPEEIQTIRLGFRDGLGEKDISKIDIIGNNLKDVHMSFEQPADYLTRVFPKIRMKAESACSGCLIPLFSSLRRIQEEGIEFSAETNLILGKGGFINTGKKALFIGKCTNAFNNKGPWLSGCPPNKEEVFEFLKNNLR